MNIVRLKILREVARQGSLGGAASALNYTTSAISQQISTLEREAGVTLVERLPRGIRLTEPGRTLLSRAENILMEIHAAKLELEAFSSAAFGRVRLGVFPAANAFLIPQAIISFRQKFPDADLVLSEVICDDAIFSLEERRLDIALVYEFPSIPLNTQANVQLGWLLDDPLHIILPIGHRLADQDPVPLDDLAKENWIAYERDTVSGKALALACSAVGFDPHIIVRTDDHIAFQRLVAAGAGIAPMSALLLGLPRADVVVRKLAGPGLIRKVSIATSTGPAKSELVPALKHALERSGEQFQH